MALHRLTAQHRAIMRMLVAGHSHEDIVTELKVSSALITRLKGDPLFINEQARLQQQIESRFVAQQALENDPVTRFFSEKALVAAKTLGQVIEEGQRDTDRVKASTELLDRAGYIKTQRVEVDQTVTLSDVGASTLAQAMRESQVGAPVVDGVEEDTEDSGESEES